MLNASHHWFSALCVTAAVTFIIQDRTPIRLAGAGAFCGLAAFFTQARGLVAVLGFAAFLVWEHHDQVRARSLWVKEASLLFGLLAAVSAASAYFISKAGWHRFWFCTVKFGIRYYPKDAEANFAQGIRDGFTRRNRRGTIYRRGRMAFIHATLPLVYVLFTMRYCPQSRVRPDQNWNKLMLLNFIGIALFLGVAPAANWFRLGSASLPGLILLVWLASSVEKYCRALLNGLWLAGCSMAAVQPWPARIHGWYSLDLPAGRTGFFNADTRDKYAWLRDRTRPADFFFDAAALPRMYFL
jgi:hypothetical protein